MKGLKKVAQVTAMTAIPFATQAEITVLDEASLGAVTGQAGVTIDIDKALVSIAEIAYEDQGFLVIEGLELYGGINGDYLDQIRIHVDVAGSGDPRADIPTGTAGEYLYEESILQGLANIDEITDNINAVEHDPQVSDGDLVISMRTTGLYPVDFSLDINSVSLARQVNLNGNQNRSHVGNLVNANPGSTVLMSDLHILGNLGPIDIVVQEETESMNVNAYFNVDGRVTLPFMGTSLEFALHNTRGQVIGLGPGGEPVSFAHAQANVGVADNWLGAGEDALRIELQDFSGDLDIDRIAMGNGKSIGAVYMTDLAIAADMVVYGH